VLSNKFLALEKKSEHQIKTNIQFNAHINVLEAQAKVDATAKTTAQGELVKVQGELATAAATARAEITAKTTAQGELVKVQGELVKAKSDYAGAKIIIGQANEYIKGLFDENKNMKKSLSEGNKLDAYTKNLQAELSISNEKLAVALDEKAAALRALAQSGQKSNELLKTISGHEAAADQLRKISVMNSKATSFANAVITGRIGNIMHLMTPAAEIFESEKEYLEFASQVAQEIDNETQEAQKAQEAQEAFSEKWKGALDWDEKRAENGVVVDVCGNQVIYSLGRLKMIRIFKPGEVIPSLPTTEQQKNGIER
jgi:fructose-specific component phosphotransferase system IIB-like protein